MKSKGTWIFLRAFQGSVHRTSDIIIKVSRTDSPRRRYSMEFGVRTPTGEFGRHYQTRMDGPDTIRPFDRREFEEVLSAAEAYIAECVREDLGEDSPVHEVDTKA